VDYASDIGGSVEVMVLTRATLRWVDNVANHLCYILQRVLVVDSFAWSHEFLDDWYVTLCQTMCYPTVATLAQSLHDAIAHLTVEPESEYAPVWQQFVRWTQPFRTFEEIEGSVDLVYAYLCAVMEGAQLLPW
jgi:hypothetical protein